MPTQVIGSTSKPLLQVRDDELRSLTAKPETGMGFYVAEAAGGKLYAVLSDGAALPLQADPIYFDLTALVAGTPVPKARVVGSLTLGSAMPDRASATSALAALGISQHYAGAPGAFPLIAAVTLSVDTVFHRYLSSSTDGRYVGGTLAAKTYLTTALDATYANSGFAAVGRFALPLPLPACHVIHYELPAGTAIQVGTVSPLFGQAGGGVEILLLAAQPAVAVKTTKVPEF